MTNYVIMSVYANDDADFFRLAVNSISSVDVILIGVDGEIPPSLEYVIKTFSDRPEVRVAYFPRNRGLASVLNDLITEALSDNTCEFIFRMDADDICHPDRFILQSNFMRSYPNIGISGSWAKVIDEGNREVSELRKSGEDNILKRRLSYDSPFVHPSVVFRAALLRKGWRYPTNTVRFEDVALWARLAISGIEFSNLQLPLLCYRQTPSTYNRRTGWRKSWCELRIRVSYIQNTNKWQLHFLIIAFGIFFFKTTLSSQLLHILYHVRKQVLRINP